MSAYTTPSNVKHAAVHRWAELKLDVDRGEVPHHVGDDFVDD